MSKEKPVFSLVSGRFFDGRIWRKVRDELRAKGYHSITHNLDVETGAVNLDEHAQAVREREEQKGAEQYVDVGWSWGANVAIRQLDGSAVSRIILPAGVFDPSSLKWTKKQAPSTSHNPDYSLLSALSRNPGANFSAVARDLVRLCFLTDVADPAVIDETVRKMRKHPKPEYEEPALLKAPKVPLVYFRLERDMAVLNQDEIAATIGATVVSFPADHTPMVSNPVDFASLLIHTVETAA